MKKIIENWEGIEETEKLIREQTGDPEAGFNAGTYWLGGDGRHLGIVAKYRGKKGKKNDETFTASYKEIFVYAKFCPFTGLPLYETEQELFDASRKSQNS